VGNDAFTPAPGTMISGTTSDPPAHVGVPGVVVTSAGRDDTVSIAISGDLDAGTQDVIRSALLSIVGSRQPHHVFLDLSRLDFCDCAGARMLVLVQREIVARGAACTARNPQPQVAWLMEWLRQNPR
jgi:anti-sigma B factor antagonist